MDESLPSNLWTARPDQPRTGHRTPTAQTATRQDASPEIPPARTLDKPQESERQISHARNHLARSARRSEPAQKQPRQFTRWIEAK